MSSDQKIHADPTKDFFVAMITRDISLSDCIFDLLDNSIDGARRNLSQKAKQSDSLDGYWAKLIFDKDKFCLTDNCGGITLDDAINYAFHFGRKKDSPVDVAHGIGLYGIGMKRAIFKIGQNATIESETVNDSFLVKVDVEAWEKSDRWEFDYEDRARSGSFGTSILINKLNPNISNQFYDSTFKTTLIMAIARDYSFIISAGFRIYIDEIQVPQYNYELRENEELVPLSKSYEDGGVDIRIVAGIIDDIPDDIPIDLKPDKVDRYGWFIVCNNRIVLPADKTTRTIWGDDNYNVWHNQYNGFAGFVFFSCDDPKLLPWTTTKRDVDTGDPLYRRTVGEMKAVTDEYIAYTNRRKADLEKAKNAEKSNQMVNVKVLTTNRGLTLPSVGFAEDNPKVESATISYSKPKEEVDEVKKSLGNWSMSNRDVGRATFDYYRKMELGK